MEQQTVKYLELQGDRMVSFTDRGKPFTFILNRLKPEDWKKLWAELQFTSSSKKDKSTRTHDNTSPAVDMVTRCVKDVRGYRLTTGEEFTTLPNWRERLPIGHRSHVGMILQDARFDDDGEFVFDPEYEIVRLRAQWGSIAEGEMLEHSGLVHRMLPVSAEQQRRVNRAKSQSIVVGGSRTDETIYPSLHHLYLELYDELIVSVSGYSVGGTEISTADEARGQMDAVHKVAAVLGLFRPPETDSRA